MADRLAHARCRAFTLVELLIVTMILAILAALVIPKLTSASALAQASNTAAQLSQLRGTLERYKLEHGDLYPTIVQLWDNLTMKTDRNGTLNVNGDFGGYLLDMPENTYTESSTVVAPGSETANDGWIYDTSLNPPLSAVGFDEVTQTYTAP